MHFSRLIILFLLISSFCKAQDFQVISPNGKISVKVRNVDDHGLRDRDVRECQRHLEGTYVIRLFAEFEIALRFIWQHVRHSPNPPRTQISRLMDAMVARHHVPTDKGVSP